MIKEGHQPEETELILLDYLESFSLVKQQQQEQEKSAIVTQQEVTTDQSSKNISKENRKHKIAGSLDQC